MSKESFILVEFKNGSTSFDVKVDSDTQLILALAGLEGYLAAQTGLEVKEIRELIDDAKTGVTVRPKDEELVEPKTLAR